MANPELCREMTASDLDRAGLIQAEPGAEISPFAVFAPVDVLGSTRSVVVGAGAVISAFAVVHGGTVVGERARIEEHAIVGRPELGYAVGRSYLGAGGETMIGAGAVIRGGAILYASVGVGEDTVVGHHTVLRTGVRVGTETQLGHHLTVERDVHLGHGVRCSPGTHLTSSTHVANRVFLGAGIRTVNDKTLTWRDPNRSPHLEPPRFETGAKVGSGSTIMSGVTIGEDAMVGAGSVVTCDIPAGTVAFGSPARVRGRTS